MFAVVWRARRATVLLTNRRTAAPAAPRCMFVAKDSRARSWPSANSWPSGLTSTMQMGKFVMLESMMWSKLHCATYMRVYRR